MTDRVSQSNPRMIQHQQGKAVGLVSRQPTSLMAFLPTEFLARVSYADYGVAAP